MLVMSLTFSQHYPSIFTLCYFSCILSCIVAPPISSPKAPEFINLLITNNCKMPDDIPFSSNSDPETFDFLSTSLQTCQTDEAEKEDEIARAYCSEVFDVLQNITCVDYNISLTKINSSRFSSDVCQDFSDMRDALPKQKGYISGKLADEDLCKLLCSPKYEPLCKTLVWSYYVQAQVRSNALENKAKEEKNTDTDILISKDFNAKTEFVNDSNSEQQPNNAQISNENDRTSSAGGSSIAPKQVKDAPTDINSNDLNNGVTSNSKTSVSVPSVVSNKNETTTDQQKHTSDLIAKTISQSEKSNSLAVTNASEQSVIEKTKEHLEPSKKSKDLNHGEGKKQGSIQPKEVTVNDLSVKEKTDANHLTSVNDVENTDQNEKSDGIAQTSDVNKDIASNNNVQTNRKSDNPVYPGDDELNSIDLQEQEDKNTVNKMQTNSKTSTVVDKSKNTEKTKETESVISSVITPDTSDLTTMQITPEKNEDDQAQEDRDQEQYNGTENEDDYPKEYENQPTKDKDTEVKNPVASEVAHLNETPVMNSRNGASRVHDDVQIVPAFPEQEDSHFFFYFLSIVLILMAGYLIFHNKQKIIALIVEGRHERRRRSHGAGYKKLETK